MATRSFVRPVFQGAIHGCGKPTSITASVGDAPHAAAAFVATGRPADNRWQPYESGNPATVRHFA
jgi:para-nitrobenzyl esterase